MDQSPARHYLQRLFAPSDRVAVVAVPRAEGWKAQQRFPTALGACGERFQRWLRHLNAQGHDIFVGVNPVGERRRREKQDIVAVRRLQLDLDEHGAARLRGLLEDVEGGAIPPVAGIVGTSEDRYQVLWDVAPGWDPTAAEAVMMGLAIRYGGDRSVADVARVLRLPGFRNKKPGRRDALVTWDYQGGQPVRPGGFKELPLEPKGASRRRASGGRVNGWRSQSERDWAWVRDRLRRGADPAALKSVLESSRQDKPKPGYYADRTVRRAQESLAIEEGRGR